MAKRVAGWTLGLVFVGVAAFAQTPGTGIAADLQRNYGQLKANLTAAADLVAEADYGFKVGSTPEARTYGQLFGHIANAQFGECAGAKQVANPNQGTNLEQLTTKAEFVKALADSFAFCDDAFSSVSDQSALEVLPGGRRGPHARATELYALIAHSNEMYGTVAAYLRSRNIVPPSTANRGR